MKIVIAFVLTCISLAFANDYTVKIKNDGSTIPGGTVRYVAEVFDEGVPAEGPFRYEWVDNAIPQHSSSHESNSNKDEWIVSYAGIDSGSYTAFLTVKKLINSGYVSVASRKSNLSVTKHLHGAFLVSSKVSDTDYIATHSVVLTAPSAKYLEEKGAAITTRWYIDGVYYASTNGLKLSVKYPKIYRRIAVQALVVAQLGGEKQSDTFQTVYTYVDNPVIYPVVNHYTECNASFPFVDKHNEVEVKEGTILGCFTRTFRLWDSLFPEGIAWHRPLLTFKSSDGANFGNRIDDVNKKVPTQSVPNPIDYSTIDARMQLLKEGEQMGLDKITNPAVKSLVEQQMYERNKYIPHLTQTNIDERFSKSLEAIDAKLNEIENAQKIPDPIAREAALNRIKYKYKKLSMRAKEVDARLKEYLDNIHARKVTENSESNKSQQHNQDRIPTLLKPDVIESKVKDVSKRIENLKNAEELALNRIDDPIIKSIVMDRIQEQNKKIPILLKSNTFDTPVSKVLDDIHKKIDDEIQRSSDVPLNEIDDPNVKETIINEIDARNQILKEKSKELDQTLELPLSEIRERIKELKEVEDSAVESISDPDDKEEVISTIDKENEKIPVLTFPMMMGKNIPFVMDLINSKMGALMGNEALITRNVTDPIVQSMVASKFDKVNYILNSKFKMLSDSFSSMLNPVTDSVDESSTELKKTPVLTKSLDSEVEDLDFPASLASNFSTALDAINDKINSFKDTTNTVTQNITFPAIQALIAAKFDKVSNILTTKYKALSDNFTTIVDTIVAKLANATSDISKPTVAKNKKVPKLGLSLDSENESTFDPTDTIENYTSALDTIRTRIDELQDSQDAITQNITDPFVKSIVASKLDTVNYILNSKFKLLSDNFTTFLNTIAAQKFKFMKIPKLSLSPDSDVEDLSMPASLATNFSIALDAINTRINDLKNTSSIITQNITIPAVQALVSSKLDKVNTILSTKYQELSNNFTSIIDMINSKLINASSDTSKKSPKKPKKVPKLSMSLNGTDGDDFLSDPSEIITNFTIALDAIRTRIDDLKNSEDVITQNITNPFAQTIVAAKLDRINFLLKTKYKQMNDNFTNIMNTINAKLVNTSEEQPLEGVRTIPILTKTAGAPTIVDAVRTKITSKSKATDPSVKYIKNPAVKEIVMNKIIDQNKNLSTIADKVEINLAAALDEFSKKAKDLNTLEDLTVDYIDDPEVRAAFVDQVDKANEEIPLLTLAKHTPKPETEELVQYTPPKNMFRIKYPTVIRF